jgi:predicted glutamine amidotransferase
MSGAPHRVRATFWLIDADDSLAAQSRREPDGTGLAWFDADGRPRVDKQPVAAYEDRAFAREARDVESQTFVAHIRYASTGGLRTENTHPFEQRGRVFAHNGVIEGLDRLDAELGDARSLVQGDTDSERFFALVTKCTAARGGDVTGGLAAAARWVAAQLPLFALNVILATPSELWALRYPDTHGLFMLEHGSGGPARHLDAASAAGTVRVRSGDLADLPAVVIASEPMDANPAWRALRPGELLHVDADLRVSSEIALPDEPRHRLTLSDLAPDAARSQAGHPTGGGRQP